jgi:glutathione S-transferase
MADVVETTPETQDTVVTKTVEGKVSDDTKTTDETVVENGVHNGDTPESTTAEAEVNNVAENGSAEVKQENGVVEENGEMAKVEDGTEAPAEGATEEPTEATTVQAEGSADAVVEEPKEEAPPKVKLHQFPTGKNIPNLSPFCLKLETFLRVNKIPYENDYGYKMGKKGKLPWIEYKGEKKNDSNMIIDYLNETFEVNLDKDFSNEQLALGRATRSMLEENTYWALIYNRYVENFNEFKKLVPLPSGGSLGFNVSQKMYQRKMQKCLDGHGLGRHSKEELYKIAEDDIKALSDLLGEKEYLLGENPSSFDCTVFGLCANILYSGMESPMCTYIKENATNIVALCDKIKETYWADWAEMCGESTQPTLKKGFSFRKKKSKAPKPKDTPAEEAPADDEAAAAATTEETTPEEKPVENGDVPAPSDDAAASEEAATETPSDEKPAEAVTEEKTETTETTTTTESTSTEATETAAEPEKEA